MISRERRVSNHLLASIQIILFNNNPFKRLLRQTRATRIRILNKNRQGIYCILYLIGLVVVAIYSELYIERKIKIHEWVMRNSILLNFLYISSFSIFFLSSIKAFMKRWLILPWSWIIYINIILLSTLIEIRNRLINFFSRCLLFMESPMFGRMELITLMSTLFLSKS